ncbi:MAG: type IV secretion system DNA-binding domain-containing protein [Afipia sp.]|nr:type IV secretion system DNA-binding domain-containing protein [Afipia sp.]
MLAKYEAQPAAAALFNGLMMALLACSLSITASFFILPPTAWQLDNDVAVTCMDLWTALRAGAFGEAILRDDLSRELSPRLVGCALAILVSAILGFRIRKSVTPIVDTREHYAGLQLMRGKAAFAAGNQMAAAEAENHDRTIQLAPGLSVPRRREVRNILLLGAIGSGKTRIILFLINELIARLKKYPKGDHAMFVHDTTGEILDGFPMSARQFAAINPDRAQTWAWRMGADLRDDRDCETAADQAVLQTGDAIWGKGGSTMYAGCMILCKAERGEAWGATELYDACLRDPKTLKQQFEQHYAPAAKLIEYDSTTGELSRTSISFLLTFRASVLRVLRPLALAWDGIPPARQFSFTQWVFGPSKGSTPRQPRVVIVQRSGRHPDMSAAWIGMVMDVITGAVGDPDLAVSQTRTRSFVIDEAPALGHLRRWPELLDTGRNKGASTIAAVQDIAQLRRIYGEAAESMVQRFATKIVCAQTHGAETTELADKMIGKREVLEKEYSTTTERGPAGTTKRTSMTPHIREVPIVRPEHLVQRLGLRNRRIKALVVGLGNILELDWPITTWPRRRD